MRKTLRGLVMIVVASAAFATTACGDDPPVLPDPPVGGGGTVGGQDGGEVPTTELMQLPIDGDCSVEGDLEGQFNASTEMFDYLTCIVPGVEQWIDDVYQNTMPHPDAYIFVPAGVNGDASQFCPYDEDSLQYCPDLKQVYLGEAAVWELYNDHGDAAPALVLAHEVTHHFQAMRPTEDIYSQETPEEEVAEENQSDCGAGDFIKWAESQNMLDRDDDIRDLATALQAAGGTVGHGSIEERLGWFDAGYLSTEAPLDVCNQLTPEEPIIQYVS